MRNVGNVVFVRRRFVFVLFDRKCTCMYISVEKKGDGGDSEVGENKESKKQGYDIAEDLLVVRKHTIG